MIPFLYVAVAITVAAGALVAWGYGKYMTAYHAGKAWQTAMWDVIIMVAGTLTTFQLWSETSDHPAVLVGYIVGNAIGSYSVTRHSNKS